MDMTAKRAELLASMQFPVAEIGVVDRALVHVSQESPAENKPAEPFFGGYMMDDMLEDMGVVSVDEDAPAATIEDLL